MSYEKYLSTGMHIGTKQITEKMKPFVYKRREDGLAIIDLATIEQRIKIAANFLAGKKNIIILTRKPTAFKAIEKFAEAVSCKAITGRFLAGTITNPNVKNYYEPDAIIVIDPLIDKQAIKEAEAVRVPVVAFVDTNNEIDKIDLIVPINNKGRKSIAMALYLLALEILLARKAIKSASEFPYKPEDFEGREEVAEETKREKKKSKKR